MAYPDLGEVAPYVPGPDRPFALEQLAAVQAPRARRRWPVRPSWLLPAALLIVVLGSAPLAWPFLNPPRQILMVAKRAAPPPAPAPTTFVLRGVLTLNHGWLRSGTGSCTGSGGFSDIHVGAQVVVTDAAGAVIAVTELGEGVVLDKECFFGFRAVAVPLGRGFYGVEVTHRGRVQFSESDAREELGVGLTLG